LKEWKGDKENPTEVKFRFDPEGVSASDYGYYNVPNSGQQANSIIFDNYEMAHFRLLTDMNFYLMVDHTLNQLVNYLNNIR
jgi:hypothetical protein